MIVNNKQLRRLALPTLSANRRTCTKARGRILHARSQKRLIAIAVAVFLCARFARFLRSRYARHIGVRSARTLAQLPQFSICSRMTNTQQGSRLYPSLSLALSHARPVWHAAGITLRSLLAALRLCENCAWQIPRKLGSCHTQPLSLRSVAEWRAFSLKPLLARFVS